MFRKRLKKIVFVFSVLLSMLVLNVSAYANTLPADKIDGYYTIGAPIDLSISPHYYDLGALSPSGDFIGVIPRANCYVVPTDSNAGYSWYEGYLNHDLYWFEYSPLPNSGADIFIKFRDRTGLTSFSIQNPLVFYNWDDLNSNYNVNIALYEPTDINGTTMNIIYVNYSYSFYIPFVDASGNEYVSIETIAEVVPITYVTGDYWVGIPLFNPDVITNNVILAHQSFGSSNACYLADATVSIFSTYSTQVYLNSYGAGSPSQLSFQEAMTMARLASIYSVDEVRDVTVFEDLDWTGWLINAISGFMDFEILPGMSFAGMLGLLVGMSLFIVFLKVFAGG